RKASKQVKQVADVFHEASLKRLSHIARRRGRDRRKPIMTIFPASAGFGGLAPHKEEVELELDSSHMKFLRSSIGDEALDRMHSLFRLCGLNANAQLSPIEIAFLLEMIGLRRKSMAPPSIGGGQAQPTETVPNTAFDQFVLRHQHELKKTGPLPTRAFIARGERLKTGFRKCDADGDGFLTKTDFEIALQKLDVIMSDLELHRIWRTLDWDHDGTVAWIEFLRAAWYNTLDDEAKKLEIANFSIDLFAYLPTMIRRATPTSSGNGDGKSAKQRFKAVATTVKNVQAIRTNTVSASVVLPTPPPVKSRMESFGARLLTTTSMMWLDRAKRNGRVTSSNATTKRAPARSMTKQVGYPDIVRRHIFIVEYTAVILAALLGVACGMISIEVEQHVPKPENDPTSMLPPTTDINIALSILEVAAMYLVAVICAFRLTVCVNLVLYPQDAEREFLTRSIARAAFQVAPRKDTVYGIDPMQGSHRCGLLRWLIMFGTRRYVLRFIIRFLVGRVLWRAMTKSAAKDAMRYLVLPLNALMDGWTLRHVMFNCRVSIIGPPCAMAIMEQFFHDEGNDARGFQRVDYMRVIGCVAVCKRAVPPVVEIMLDHMRRAWIKRGFWPIDETCTCVNLPHERCPVHPLDDTERLIVSLKLYARQTHRSNAETVECHTKNMLFLLVVGLIIDGHLEWGERRLYMRAFRAAHMLPEWRSVLQLKQDFVEGKGVRAADIYARINRFETKSRLLTDAALQWKDDDDDRTITSTPFLESITYMAERIRSEKWLSLIDDETDAGEAIFYMAVVSCNIIVSIIELLTVFTTALVAANGVVVCTRLILHPINAEREFLARAITRSALQIAPTQDVMFGIDPLHGAPRFAMTLWTMLYNSKRFLFRFILKLIIRTLGWQSAIVLPINAIVNAWSLRVRVLDCRKSIIGPPCAIALLERFFIHEQASIGPFQRVDYLRALGCVMVCKRCAPPNLQLMVYRMRREWLKVDLWPIGEGCTCLSGLISRCQLHPLDDIDRFMISLTLYARQQHRPSSNQALEHLKSIFFFLIVALIIDGKLEWSERRFCLRACRAAGFQQEWRAVGLLRGNFVDGKGISVQDVLSIIKPVLSHPTQRALAQVDEGDEGEELDEQEVKEPITTPLWESLVYISNRLSSALSC
ncbi:TPA: hypothetical protein N0F65_010525, partial [Lagenidium giganteum]